MPPHLFPGLLVEEHDTAAVGQVRIGRAKRARECLFQHRSLGRALQRRESSLFLDSPQAVHAVPFGENNACLQRANSTDDSQYSKRELGCPLNELTDRYQLKAAPSPRHHSHPCELLLVEVADVLAEASAGHDVLSWHHHRQRHPGAMSVDSCGYLARYEATTDQDNRVFACVLSVIPRNVGRAGISQQIFKFLL